MNLDLSQPWTSIVPIDSVVPNPEQPRKNFDQAALERTAKSLSRQQIQPIAVVPFQDPSRPDVRWMIVDGERRWRGLRGMGAKSIKIAYDPSQPMDALAVFEASLASNFCREGHSHEEITHAVARLVEAGRSDAEISELVGKGLVWVNNYRRLAKLHPDLLKRMDSAPEGERRLPIKIALMLVSLQPFSQLGEWDKVKEMPVSDAFHKLRTSGKVRHGASRDRLDDVQYVIGKVQTARQNMNTIATLPAVMLGKLSEGELCEVEKTLLAASEQLDNALGLIREAKKNLTPAA